MGMAVSFQGKGLEVLECDAEHTCVLREPNKPTAVRGKAFLKHLVAGTFIGNTCSYQRS